MGADAAAEAGEFLLIDKPAGWTSFDVVHRIRSMMGGIKTGHAGTLDPMATGLLIVCTGRKRKEIDSFMGLEKEYEAEMELGIRTPSFDMETEVLERQDPSGCTESQVRSAVEALLGTRMQTPPMYSAAKVDGKRLYMLARKGIEIERKPREVVIHAISAIAVAMPRVRFTVACSKGTYIRSLVHDVGERLGCGATMTALRRTRIGPYSVDSSMTLVQLQGRSAAPAQSV